MSAAACQLPALVRRSEALAKPSTYDYFIHNISPALTGAQELP